MASLVPGSFIKFWNHWLFPFRWWMTTMGYIFQRIWQFWHKIELHFQYSKIWYPALYMAHLWRPFVCFPCDYGKPHSALILPNFKAAFQVPNVSQFFWFSLFLHAVRLASFSLASVTHHCWGSYSLPMPFPLPSLASPTLCSERQAFSCLLML